MDDPEHISLEGFTDEALSDFEDIEKKLKKLVDTSDEGRLIKKEADEALTPQEVQERAFAPTRYLFATEDATYVLTMASDVQVDWEDEETVELYQTMQSQVGEISFILPSLLSQ